MIREYFRLSFHLQYRLELNSQEFGWASARTHQLALDHNLPVVVQVKAHLGRLRDKFGEDNFAKWWREFTGEEPPTDLEVDTSTIL